VGKNGDKIDLPKLKKALGCEVTQISALKGTGIKEAAEKAVRADQTGTGNIAVHKFSPETEEALEEIEGMLGADIAAEQRRFYAVKLFERDDKIAARMKNVP